MPDFTERASFIKICGVTSSDGADAAMAAGASAIGLIFAESLRRVTLDQAREIAAFARGAALRVGVFRNDEAAIVPTLDRVDLDIVQVHGGLRAETLSELRERGVGVIKALVIGSSEFLTFDESLVNAVLIDGTTPGSGAEHSWDELSRRSFAGPIIAAGGLTPFNVGRVVELTGAWGVDVSTGVESSPGVKDRQLVMDFVSAARRQFALREERSD